MEINCKDCGSSIIITRQQLGRKYCDTCKQKRHKEQKRKESKQAYQREMANRKPQIRFCIRCNIQLPITAKGNQKRCLLCAAIVQRQQSSESSRRYRKFVPKTPIKPTLYKEDFGDLSTLKIGAISELFVAANLMRHDFIVSKPLSDGTEYDLIADKNGNIFRIEVRTGYYRNGNIYPIAGNYKHKNFDILAAVCDGKIRYIKNCK